MGRHRNRNRRKFFSSNNLPQNIPQGPPRQQVSVAQSVSFTGPLPPPAMLEKYNQVFPGCAERIVAMAESQLAHRHQLERTHLHGSQLAERTGQACGFLLGLVAIVGGIWLIANGKDVQGLVSVLGAISALAGVFIYGRHAQAKEREQKREQSQQLPLPYGQDDKI